MCIFFFFCNIFSATLGGIFGVISLFKMAPKHSAKVLSGVPKCKKADMLCRGNVSDLA